MKKFLVALLFPFSVQAAPFLEGDIESGVSFCTLSGLPAVITAKVDAAALKCRWDLAGLPAGNYTVTATASNMWATSGPSAPLSFVRPATASAPAALKLVP